MVSADPRFDDRAVVDAVRAGEPWAQEYVVRMIRSCARGMSRTVPRDVLDDLVWEDIAQEAALRFFAVGVFRFESGRSLGAYVYGCVRRAFLCTLRAARRRKRREATIALAGPAALVGNVERTMLLSRILEGLSASSRTLLERRYLDGSSYQELAADMKLAESSVRSKVSRCLAEAAHALSRMPTPGLVRGQENLARVWKHGRVIHVAGRRDSS